MDDDEEDEPAQHQKVQRPGDLDVQTPRHVTLIFTTRLLQNFNHIYADRNDASWAGFGIFCGVMTLLSS